MKSYLWEITARYAVSFGVSYTSFSTPALSVTYKNWKLISVFIEFFNLHIEFFPNWDMD